jgi:hypothetical protein
MHVGVLLLSCVVLLVAVPAAGTAGGGQADSPGVILGVRRWGVKPELWHGVLLHMAKRYSTAYSIA